MPPVLYGIAHYLLIIGKPFMIVSISTIIIRVKFDLVFGGSNVAIATEFAANHCRYCRRSS